MPRPRNELKGCARKLRNKSTDAERLLWKRLQHSQLEGIKFRRQQAIANYIVDFVSFEAGIVIELDGSQHYLNRSYDGQRDCFLAANGFEVLRFWDHELIENMEGVLEVIRQHCLERTSPTPPRPPPSRGGGGPGRSE